MFMFMSCHVRHLTDLLASYPPLLTRQEAVRFNQPLDWDTSRVTIMGEMFRVHSARALRSDSSLEPSLPLHAACTAAAPPATSPHHMPSFRLGRERGRSTSR